MTLPRTFNETLKWLSIIDTHLNAEIILVVQIQCCFTSAEIIRSIKDGESRLATSTFTQLLNSDSGGIGNTAA